MKYFREAFDNPKTAEELAAERAALVALKEIAQTPEEPREYLVGEFVEGKGIFLGTKGLPGEYNIFVAPEDWKSSSGERVLRFSDAAKDLSRAKNWHGHDGGDVVDAYALCECFEDGSYDNRWFFPDTGLLRRMFDNRDVGAFRGSFLVESYVPDAGHYPGLYGSYTSDGEGYLVGVSLKTGKQDYFHFTLDTVCCRPCRAERILKPEPRP
jgi:hypothetical protein